MWMQMGVCRLFGGGGRRGMGREEVGIWGEWQRIELCFSRVIGGSVFLSILPVEASRQWSNGGLFSR